MRRLREQQGEHERQKGEVQSIQRQWNEAHAAAMEKQMRECGKKVKEVERTLQQCKRKEGECGKTWQHCDRSTRWRSGRTSEVRRRERSSLCTSTLAGGCLKRS